MNSFSDIVDRKQAPEAKPGSTAAFITQKLEPGKALTAKLAAKTTDAREVEGRSTDLLIQGLIDRLPKPDSIWSLDDRAKWLRTADSVFGLVYKTGDDEHREISIAFVKPKPAGVAKEESRG